LQKKDNPRKQHLEEIAQVEEIAQGEEIPQPQAIER
jgi:hypothetical protein